MLYFEKYADFDRVDEPVAVTLPFKKGALNDRGVVIYDENGECVSQSRVLGKWDDGSVKWLKVNFLANLPANCAKRYEFKIAEPQENSSINYKQTNEGLMINNGCIKLKLNNQGKKPFGSFICGQTVSEDVNLFLKSDEGSFDGVLTSGWTIEDEGAVMLRLYANGQFTDGACFRISLCVYSNKPFVQTDIKLINKREDIILKEVYFNIKLAEKKQTLHLATSNYETNLREGSDRLHLMIDDNYLIYEANEHIPEVFYGTFFASAKNQNGGLCATLYQAYQNFPKSLTVTPECISVGIVPEEYGDITLSKGMAKTHTVFLHFFDKDEDISIIDKRSLMLQAPDRPIVSADIYKESGIFHGLFVDNKQVECERALITSIDKRGRAYGMLHWGDCPDEGYSQQGRGNGEPVWTNNEYDFPYAAFQMYVRTGERRFLDYLLIAAAHWVDVDVCHYSEEPLRQGAQIIHSAGHTSGYVEISHEWVEGLFSYYYMTGDSFVYDTVIGIGENILRHLDEPRYHKKGEINARETGWALRALVALYKETNDPYWLKKTDFIISHFNEWSNMYGGSWLAPYTSHTKIRVPFMIAIAASSLMRYYHIKPNESIRKMILDAVDDLLDNALMDNGLFYYKELPSLRRLGANTLVLEALAYAYELTGDRKYLEAGLPTFNEYLNKPLGWGASKSKIKDGILLSGGGPKGFAQSFYPIMIYYYYLSQER